MQQEAATMTKRNLVIYHDNCADGFASMLVAKAALGDSADYFPVNYNSYILDPQPTADTFLLGYKKTNTSVDLHNRENIFIVDFSFKRGELNHIAQYALGLPSIIVLDHHKTARDELMKIVDVDDHRDAWIKHPELVGQVHVTFDMSKAGCVLTHEYFSNEPGGAMPAFIHLIGKRDVWQHKGKPYERDAEALNMYVGLVGYNEEKWNGLWSERFLYEEALPKGYAILDFFWAKVNEAMGHAVGPLKASWHGLIVTPPVGVQFTDKGLNDLTYYVVNAPYWMASDLGNKLAESCDFAVVWSLQKDQTVIASIRSKTGTTFASDVAKKFGGGGHGPAAGCKFNNFEEFQKAFL